MVSALVALAPATFILSLALCIKFLVPCFMLCIVVSSAIVETSAGAEGTEEDRRSGAQLGAALRRVQVQEGKALVQTLSKVK